MIGVTCWLSYSVVLVMPGAWQQPVRYIKYTITHDYVVDQ